MPESDPSDGEITDADEFLREIGNIERDETLIDFVGQGYDVNAPGDQAVADLLGAWRDDVGRAPVNVELPSAAIARGAVPPAPTEGNPVSDSIADRARQLMALADQAPSAELQQLMQNVNDWNAQAQAILGEGATGAMLISQMTQQVIQTCGELLEGIERMRQVARETGGGHLGG